MCIYYQFLWHGGHYGNIEKLGVGVQHATERTTTADADIVHENNTYNNNNNSNNDAVTPISSSYKYMYIRGPIHYYISNTILLFGECTIAAVLHALVANSYSATIWHMRWSLQSATFLLVQRVIRKKSRNICNLKSNETFIIHFIPFFFKICVRPSLDIFTYAVIIFTFYVIFNFFFFA